LNTLFLLGGCSLHDKQNAKATDAVLIVQGFNETLHKYVEVVHELYSAGFSVALYDHRGQVNNGVGLYSWSLQ